MLRKAALFYIFLHPLLLQAQIGYFADGRQLNVVDVEQQKVIEQINYSHLAEQTRIKTVSRMGQRQYLVETEHFAVVPTIGGSEAVNRIYFIVDGLFTKVNLSGWGANFIVGTNYIFYLDKKYKSARLFDFVLNKYININDNELQALNYPNMKVHATKLGNGIVYSRTADLRMGYYSFSSGVTNTVFEEGYRYWQGLPLNEVILFNGSKKYLLDEKLNKQPMEVDCKDLGHQTFVEGRCYGTVTKFSWWRMAEYEELMVVDEKGELKSLDIYSSGDFGRFINYEYKPQVVSH